MNHKTCYIILHLNSTATKAEIKTAYRKLAVVYHPDKPGGDEAKFKIIKQAYDTLMRVAPEKKTQPQATNYNHRELAEPKVRFIKTALDEKGYIIYMDICGVQKVTGTLDNVWVVSNTQAYSREMSRTLFRLSVEEVKELNYVINLEILGINGKEYDVTTPIRFEKPPKPKSRLEKLFNNIW